MDEDDDSDLVIVVAGQFVARLGQAAVLHLYELGEISVGIGDQASAETWFELARAAEGLAAGSLRARIS